MTSLRAAAPSLGRAEHRRVHRRADRRGAPVPRLGAAREPDGGAAELRPDRVHRHADPDGQEEDPPTSSASYIDVYRLADAEATARSCRSCTPAARSRARSVTAGTWTRSSRTCSPSTPRRSMEQIKRRYATKGDVLEAEKLIAGEGEEHAPALRRDGTAQRVQGPASRAQPPGHAAVPGRLHRRPATSWSPDRGAPEAARDARPGRARTAARRSSSAPPAHLDLLQARLTSSRSSRRHSRTTRSTTRPGPIQANRTTLIEAIHEAIPDAPTAAGAAPAAFLIVKSMLLTGFDAPVEQVLYLDRADAGRGAAAGHRPRQPARRRQEMRLRHRLRGRHQAPDRRRSRRTQPRTSQGA